MSAATMKIEHSILEWAVERAGMDVSDYSRRNVNYAKWLSDEKRPTVWQAEQFAKRFYLPFNYLFLMEPVKETLPIPMFRKKAGGIESVNVADMVNMLSDRQDWLSRYLRDNGYDRLGYAGSGKGERSAAALVGKMREELGLADDWAFASRNADEALRHLIDVVEDKGVVVAVSGIVGNNTRRPIKVEDCRGFCLSDDYAPFIFLNSGDAKTAQLFTLMHEFAHVLLGYSSGIGSDNYLAEATDEEKLCNSAAALFLVSDVLMSDLWQKYDGDYNSISHKFKVSRPVVAIRAKDLGYISQHELNDLFAQWERERAATTKKKTSGGNATAMMVRRYSRAFLIHVCNAIGSSQMMFTEAYRMLGIGSATFDKLVKSPTFQR